MRRLLLLIRHYLGHFFPSNARWLSPGRLSSRKADCIQQINLINAVQHQSVRPCASKLNWIDTQSIKLTPCKTRNRQANTNKTTKQTNKHKSNHTIRHCLGYGFSKRKWSALRTRLVQEIGATESGIQYCAG